VQNGAADFIATVALASARDAQMRVAEYLLDLARAYAQLGQFDDAWCWIGEAMTAVETTKERASEAEVHRIAGEIALMSPQRDAAKAEAYFGRALTTARARQAKSWELRAVHGPAVARSRQTTAGPRSSRPGLWLVHGGLRQADQAMSEIRKWLESIGLGQHGDAFEANDIDMDLLRQIDDQALRDLGHPHRRASGAAQGLPSWGTKPVFRGRLTCSSVDVPT
jgi:predicted ATPase